MTTSTLVSAWRWGREESGQLSGAAPLPRVDHPCTLLAGLQGARVLLTGASAGIGEELAYLYARLGAHLVLTAHTEALLQKVRQPISWGGSGWKTGPGCKNFLAKIQASGVTLGK